MPLSDEEATMNHSPAAGPSTASLKPSLPEGITPPPQGMSKNAMKKAARKAQIYAQRPEKRAAEKARKRERDAKLREQYKAGTLDPADQEWYHKRILTKRARQEDSGKGRKKRNKTEFGGGVIIDLGFDELMHVGEITSLSGQIGFCYSANRLAAKPFRTVLHTSFGPTASPRVWGKMTSRGWQNWTRCHWWEQGIDALAKAVKDRREGEAEPAKAVIVERPGGDSESKDLTQYLSGPVLPSTITSEHELVYLSADAEEELTTLSENEIYIIGGVVDRNRYKYMCQKRADSLGIRTARLPIGTFLAEMPTRKVLTVNQVFEILTKYLAFNDWRQAFESVIPNRKYDELGKKALRRQQRRARFAESNAAGGENSAEVANESDDSDEDDLDDIDDGEYDEEVDDNHDATEAESDRAVDTSSVAAANNKGMTSATNDDLALDEEESMNM